MYQVPSVQSAARLRLRQWWWASFWGGAIAGAIAFVIALQSQNAHLTIDSTWMLGATLVGVGQSLVLRPILGRCGPWILSCLVGASLWVGLTIAISWSLQRDRPVTLPAAQQIVNGMLSMLVVGSCQALVLRRVFRHSGWWLVGAVAGGLFGSSISLGLTSLGSMQVVSLAEGIFVWGVALGLTWACFTLPLGLVLVHRLVPRTD